MAVMGFHTIDNVHIDLDLILICQCSSEVKKLAQIAPVWSERLGAHPPHVFAALHWMTVSPTELQQLHLVMENHTACWGRHPKAGAWQHKTLLSSCDISPRTKTVAENLRCSESCYHRGVIFEPDRDDLISIGFYLPWYRLGCPEGNMNCKLKSFIYPTVHIGLSCVRNDTGLKWHTEMCFIVTDYKIYRNHQCKLTCFPNVSRQHLIYFMLFGMDDEVQRGIWGN